MSALAHRVFQQGAELLCRDHKAVVYRKARAILEWLDFGPVHQRLVQGALAAAAHGR